jgi:hypothetical protein
VIGPRRALRRMVLLVTLAAALGVAGGGAAWLLVRLIGIIRTLALFHRWGTHLPSFSDFHPDWTLLVTAVQPGAAVSSGAIVLVAMAATFGAAARATFTSIVFTCDRADRRRAGEPPAGVDEAGHLLGICTRTDVLWVSAGRRETEHPQPGWLRSLRRSTSKPSRRLDAGGGEGIVSVAPRTWHRPLTHCVRSTVSG